MEKPLIRAERDLLEVLRQHHALHGPVERTVLSVEARGRGLEFGRPLARLISLGLAEEFTRKPFFLYRLFGVRSVVLLRPTAAGLAEALGDPSASQSLATDAPAEATPPATAVPVDNATSSDSIPTDAAPETPPSGPDLKGSTTVGASIPPSDVAETSPDAKPKVTKPKPKPAKAKARPKPITAFTEDLGGTPLPLAQPALPPQVDPSTIEGLRETLSVMGLDLTPAGEALAAHHIAQGATPAEALTQIVLFAFGHAVQQDLYAGGPVADLGLRDYATEVLREVGKLCTAGELTQAAFDRLKDKLWSVLNESLDREANVRVLLCDPMGGAAPPAVLPEDLRRSADE